MPAAFTGHVIWYPAALETTGGRLNPVSATSHFAWHPPTRAFMERKLKTPGSYRPFELAPPPRVSLFAGAPGLCISNWPTYSAPPGPRIFEGGAKNLIAIAGCPFRFPPAVASLVGTLIPYIAD